MKHFLMLISLISLFTHSVWGQSIQQVAYAYDANGNRSQRILQAIPDLVPSLIAQPNIAYGNTDMSFRLTVSELNGVNTTGPITVLLTKDPLYTINFNQTTTTLNGNPVQNPNWSLDSSSDPSYYIFSSTNVLAGNGTSVIVLTGQLTPAGSSGRINLSFTIVGGSGGELKITNNVATQRIDYFLQ